MILFYELYFNDLDLKKKFFFKKRELKFKFKLFIVINIVV